MTITLKWQPLHKEPHIGKCPRRKIVGDKNYTADPYTDGHTDGHTDMTFIYKKHA